MAEAKTKEQLQAEWWAAWWEEDFTWEGLATKPLQGWVVAEGLLREKDTGRVYGQPAPDSPASAEQRDATLQDYWRADPATGRLRSDAELADELVAAEGQPLVHRIHLPLAYADGARTGKEFWTNDALDALIAPRLLAATDIVPVRDLNSPRMSGTDGRVQLRGAVLLAGLSHPQGTRNRLSIHCEKAAFLSQANFSQAVFSENARFEGAIFSREAIFNRATFPGYTNFENVKFLEYAYFMQADFSEYANFESVKFSESAAFSGTKFSKTANFARARFSGEADFNTATFSDGADFLLAIFSGGASFYNATFSGHALFANATLAEIVGFEGATFSGEAIFYDAAISANVRFKNATFHKKADFQNVRFCVVEMESESDLSVSGSKVGAGPNDSDDARTPEKKANFSLTSFKGEADFEGSEFEHLADFKDAGFVDRASFNSAKFKKGVSFRSAAFQNSFSLTGAVISKYLDFKDVTFTGTFRLNSVETDLSKLQLAGLFEGAQFNNVFSWSVAPWLPISAFSGAWFERGILLKETSLDQVERELDAELDTALSFQGEMREDALRGLEGGALRVKRALDQAADRLREQSYYRLELRARRKQKGTPWSEKFFSDLYAVSSNYGASMWRPLGWLLFLVLLFALLYAGVTTGVKFPGSLAETVLGRTLKLPQLYAAAGVPLEPWPRIRWEALVEGFNVSLSRIFPFGAFEEVTKDWITAQGEEHGPLAAIGLRVVASIQTAFVLILVFLSGLAVRRRFQIS